MHAHPLSEIRAGGAVVERAEFPSPPRAYVVEGSQGEQVAATRLGDHRLAVRRTRLIGARQEALFPDYRHHDVVELAIRELKEGSGLNHYISDWISANAA